jgi:hypothetical protein
MPIDISGGRLTTEYRYHQGYWDGAEREFRGFGMVEQRDSEVFEDFARHDLQGLIERVHFSPPLLTRTWFHQGPIGDEHGHWAEVDPAGVWPGDPPLLPRPEPVAAFLRGLPRRARRDALRALRGSVLRTELYALDGSGRASCPYTVTETSHGLYEVVPDGGDGHRLACEPAEASGAGDPSGPPRVFFPHVLAQRTTQWERGDDPLTTFAFTNDHDACGQPRQQTTVAMPRRPSLRRTVVGVGTPPDGIEVDGAKILATHTRTAYAVPMGTRYIHDRVADVRSFELAKPFPWIEGEGDTVQKALKHLAAAAQDIRRLFKALPPDWTPDPAVLDGVRLAGHTRNRYDGEAFLGLDGRQVERGALTRSESLAFTDAELDSAYEAEDTSNDRRPTYLDGGAGLPAGAPDGFADDLGYLRETHATPSRETLRHYYVATQQRAFDFQLLRDDPATPKRGLVLATRDPLGHETRITPDRYWMLPALVRDAAGLETEADYDYRVLQPREVTDPNGNRTLYAFTPLGLLASIAVMGKEGEAEGDSPAVPGTRFAYDLLAYDTLRQPISVRTTRRVRHVHDTGAPPAERDATVETVEYSDGFGRLLQTRAQAEDLLLGESRFGGGVLPADQDQVADTLRSVKGRRPSADDPPLETIRLPGIVAMAVAGGKLFAVTREGGPWERDPAKYGLWARDPATYGAGWRRVDGASQIVGMAAAGSKLFAVTWDDRLLTREPTLREVGWARIGIAGGTYLLAASGGRLLGRCGHVAQRDHKVAFASAAFPGAYLRINGWGITPERPGGQVNCQRHVGPLEKFVIRPQGDDGTVAFMAYNFTGVHLRMNAEDLTGSSPSGGGTVDCECAGGPCAGEPESAIRPVGPWARLRLEELGDGTVAIASVAFPGAYLRLDAHDFTESADAGGGEVSCQRHVGSTEKFLLLRDGQLRARSAMAAEAPWRNVDLHAREAVAMVGAGGVLYAANHHNELWASADVPSSAGWSWLGDAAGAVALASDGGRLYAADGEGRLWVRPCVRGPHDLQPAGAGLWRMVDGEVARQTQNVVVSGWQVYDNKGRVIEKYEPSAPLRSRPARTASFEHAPNRRPRGSAPAPGRARRAG